MFCWPSGSLYLMCLLDYLFDVAGIALRPKCFILHKTITLPSYRATLPGSGLCGRPTAFVLGNIAREWPMWLPLSLRIGQHCPSGLCGRPLSLSYSAVDCPGVAYVVGHLAFVLGNIAREWPSAVGLFSRVLGKQHCPEWPML